MRQRSKNYFWRSLFSRQAIYAYAAAGGVTTAMQLIVLSAGVFSEKPQRTGTLPLVVELYIETLIPVWIPPVTRYNIAIVLMNGFLALFFLAVWTLNYDSSY